MNCVFTSDGVCKRCGVSSRWPDVPRNCLPGLGDMVAAGLSSLGITKERVNAVAKSVGVNDCGCHERQRKLNELGRKLGIGGNLQNS